MTDYKDEDCINRLKTHDIIAKAYSKALCDETRKILSDIDSEIAALPKSKPKILPDKLSLIDRLKAFMLKRKMTQEELALRIGVTPVTMSRWMIGKRSPALNKFKRMTDELDLDVVIVERTK